GVQRSELIRVDIGAALAGENGAPLPEGALETYQLPWSLSPGNVWENDNDAWAKWQEHAGVEAHGGKVVVIKSYDGVVEDGTTKLTLFDPATKTFTPGEAAPENIVANSWELLPNTCEVFMGNNTAGYSSVRLWAYRIGD